MNFKLIILSILSGVLLSFAWFEAFSSLFIIVAFVPLLFLERSIKSRKLRNLKVWFYSFLSFFTWNLLTTSWIWNASPFGMFAAVLVNTVLMSIIFTLFSWTRRLTNDKLGYFSFVVYWLAFEYFHHQWQMTWPWLTLGNAFANDIWIIQWYEFTGTSGGSLWALSLNVLIFSFLINKRSEIINKKVFISKIIATILLIIIPIIVSVSMFYNYEEKGQDNEIIVVQPNIDPYKDKYKISSEEQINNIFALAEPLITNKTAYIIAPETAIPKSVEENNLTNDAVIKLIHNFLLKKNSNLHFIIGASTHKFLQKDEEVPTIARKINGEEIYYISYNTALQLHKDIKPQIYHKSKLVVGVETMPYPSFFSFLSKLMIDFGGTSGNLGKQKDRTNFINNKKNIKIAPVICYESIFGEFLTEYIRNGADYIFIITNDGWWGNTAGHKQHLKYAKLRAIETRRAIARSANTGISAFINQKGELIKSVAWDKKIAIKATIKANNDQTLFVKLGDFISRISIFLSIFAFLYTIVRQFYNRKISNY